MTDRPALRPMTDRVDENCVSMGGRARRPGCAASSTIRCGRRQHPDVRAVGFVGCLVGTRFGNGSPVSRPTWDGDLAGGAPSQQQQHRCRALRELLCPCGRRGGKPLLHLGRRCLSDLCKRCGVVDVFQHSARAHLGLWGCTPSRNLLGFCVWPGGVTRRDAAGRSATDPAHIIHRLPRTPRL
jgi:hypothetical protein